MRKYTCFFAGHKLIPSDRRDEIGHQLTVSIEELIAKGVTLYEVGCSVGFDTMAANCLIKLQEKHPLISLVLILPYKSPSLVGDVNYAAILTTISRHADKIIYLYDDPVADGLWLRNLHLINGSSYCICYLTQQDSATGKTVEYAKTSGLSIINIADKLL